MLGNAVKKVRDTEGNGGVPLPSPAKGRGGGGRKRKADADDVEDDGGKALTKKRGRPAAKKTKAIKHETADDHGESVL